MVRACCMRALTSTVRVPGNARTTGGQTRRMESATSATGCATTVAVRPQRIVLDV